MASAADIESINKIRQSVGLPPLPTGGPAAPSNSGPTFKEHSDDDDSEAEPGSTLETREAAGYENFKQLQDEEKRRIDREQRKKQIQRARDVEARQKKLEGKGLGDAEEGKEQDAKSWLKGQKKRQARIERERAERLAEELAERERLAAIEYTSSDLAGVQVAHEIGDFENGESEQILTLQDAQIGEDASDQDDVLENADILARDKTTEKLDLKKRKAYDVMDDTEKGLLSQYDDKKRKAFTLDGQGATIEERDAKRQQIGEKLKATISLDILKAEPVSDYMEIKMKKPKKTKKKSTRQRNVEDDDDVPPQGEEPTDAMDIDQPKEATVSKTKTVEKDFNDDDDLASALSFSRRAALKKQKRKPEDIIRQLQEDEEEQAPIDYSAQGGLTLDDTSNFLDNLSSRPRDEQPRPAVRKSIEDPEAEGSPKEDDGQDISMNEAHTVVDNEEELLDRLRREQDTNTPDVSHSGLTEEQTLTQGLGATLNLLKQRGLVKGTDAGDKNTLYRDRQKFIIEARAREHDNEQKAKMQRERDRQSGKLTGMSAKEKEEHARWQNTQREHQSSIQAAASFNKAYKPDVQIKYVDEDGRLMNQKEAFKHLSHQFHGKGSGKQKTEKHLKKVDDEKRRMAASVLDSSQATGMNRAQESQRGKNKEAGVRLA